MTVIALREQIETLIQRGADGWRERTAVEIIISFDSTLDTGPHSPTHCRFDTDHSFKMSDSKAIEVTHASASASSASSSSSAPTAPEQTIKYVTNTLVRNGNSKHLYNPNDLLHGMEAAIATGHSRLARHAVLELVATCLKSRKPGGDDSLLHYVNAMFYIVAIDRCSPNVTALSHLTEVLKQVKATTDHAAIGRLYAGLAHTLSRGPRSSLIKSLHEFLVHRSARLIAPPAYVFNAAFPDDMYSSHAKLTHAMSTADRVGVLEEPADLERVFKGSVRNLSKKPGAASQHAFVVATDAKTLLFPLDSAVLKSIEPMTKSIQEMAFGLVDVDRKVNATVLDLSDAEFADVMRSGSTSVQSVEAHISYGLMVGFELAMMTYQCAANSATKGDCSCCRHDAKTVMPAVAASESATTLASGDSENKKPIVSQKPAATVCITERHKIMVLLWEKLRNIVDQEDNAMAMSYMDSLRTSFFDLDLLKQRVDRSFASRLELAQTRLVLLARGFGNGPFANSYLHQFASSTPLGDTVKSTIDAEVKTLITQEFDVNADRPFELPQWMFNRFTVRGQGKHSMASMFLNARAHPKVLKWDPAKVSHSHGTGFVFNDKKKTLIDRDEGLITDNMVGHMTVADPFLSAALDAQSVGARACGWVKVVNQHQFEEDKAKKKKGNTELPEPVAIAVSAMLDGVKPKDTQVLTPDLPGTHETARKLWASSFDSFCKAWGFSPSSLAKPTSSSAKKACGGGTSASPKKPKKKLAKKDADADSASEHSGDEDAAADGGDDDASDNKTKAKPTRTTRSTTTTTSTASASGSGSKRKAAQKPTQEEEAKEPSAKKRKVSASKAIAKSTDGTDSDSEMDAKESNDRDKDKPSDDTEEDEERSRKLAANAKIREMLTALMRKKDPAHNALVERCMQRSVYKM